MLGILSQKEKDMLIRARTRLTHAAPRHESVHGSMHDALQIIDGSVRLVGHVGPDTQSMTSRGPQGRSAREANAKSSRGICIRAARGTFAGIRRWVHTTLLGTSRSRWCARIVLVKRVLLQELEKGL